MVGQGKKVQKETSSSIKKRERLSRTDPYTRWDYRVVKAYVPFFKKIWKLYTGIYKGDAKYVIVDRNWIVFSKRDKDRPNIPRYFVDTTKPSLRAQPWYPNYKKAIEFSSEYRTLHNCMEQARLNYTIYVIFRMEKGEIKFALFRHKQDVRMFQYHDYVWRLVGGSPEDIPYHMIPIDRNKICKYFFMRMYTSPGYL